MGVHVITHTYTRTHVRTHTSKPHTLYDVLIHDHTHTFTRPIKSQDTHARMYVQTTKQQFHLKPRGTKAKLKKKKKSITAIV